MALPIETPSRIWRRIKEAEAHDDEMPSLPSLPDLDDSGISNLGPSSFSVEKTTLGTNPPFSVGQSTKPQPSVAPPPMYRESTPGKDPTALSIVSSLPGDPPDEEYDDLDVDISSFHRASWTGGNNDAYIDTKPSKQLVDIGPLHAGYVESETGQSSKPASLARASSNGKSSITAVAVPDHVIEFDGNLVPIDKSQILHTLGNGGSLSNSINPSDFKDVAIRKPYYPPTSVPSLPPSSPPLSSLQYTSDSQLPVWTSEVRESSVEHDLETVTVRPSAVPQIYEHSRQTTTDDLSENEAGETTEKAFRSRKPTFTSEDAETTHETGVRFSQAVVYPADWSTSAHAFQSHTSKSGIRGTRHSNLDRQNEADDLATPLPRRKSFLLSVVNSTTRPRLTVPTPHPRAKQKTIGANARLTPGPSHWFHTSGRKARLSHPLSQISNFALSSPLNTFPNGAEPETPDGVTSTSFVSTASSHDLTLHHRVNASFDPLTGPQGVGRFNAGKLNTYLHGLNRRLQEENEILVNKIKGLQAELEMLYDQGRHRGELSGVVEDEAAEQWVLEKENLEQKIAELERRLETRDKELLDEQAQRMRDKERWKGRMNEVEDGVGQIVSDLEKRVEEAETRLTASKDVERQLQSEIDSARAEGQLLKQRAEQAEQILANSKRDGSLLRSGNEGSEKLGVDVQSFTRQLEEKDRIIATLQASLTDKEREASSLQNVIRDLESSLRVTRETIETSQQDAKELRAEQRELKVELRAAQATIDKLKFESRLAPDAVKDLDKQLMETKQRLAEKEEALDVANERVTVTSDELEKARSNIQQLETALEESDRKILSDNDELLDLRSKLSIMKREQEKVKALDQSQVMSAEHAADVEALETELAEARKEIGRLSSLLEQNPARRALDKARESRIDLLEKENQELLEQLRAARDPPYFATPRRNAIMSGLSPMHRRLINLTLRTPKTPGEPLRNASWLNATGEITTAHLIDEIGRLQKELDHANESIDDKLDKLEEAGLGVVGLTKALEDARRHIVDLERELEERGQNFCLRCAGNGNERPTSRDPNSTLQLRLTMVTAELEALRKQREDELASSSGEKAVLRDATNRLNIEVRRAKEELKAAQERGHKAEKSKAELQQELARAKKTIDDMEYFLQSERSRLRTMSVENTNAAKEKERILDKLYETEQKMEQTKDRLFQLKETNIKLEAELRVERKTANIEEALIGNRETIERLRQERYQLSDKYYDLQQQLTEASKIASDLATRHAKLQMSYDGRRRQLDRQAEEIESLRTALSSQAQTLDAAWLNKKVEVDDEDLKYLASRLQSELKRIQHEANKFGRDLVHLKAERDQLITRQREEVDQHERETKQIRAQLRNLKQQLASRKENKDFVMEIQSAAESLRLRHNRECKGLFVQIRYLKAKFTREAALRDDLGYQKGYLLVLLSRYEKSEKKILAAIAQIGPISVPAKKTRSKSLRRAALAIIFISRARRASEAWREQRSACSAVAVALDNVRKNRLLKA